MRISNHVHGLYAILNDESGAFLSTPHCAIGLHETRSFTPVGSRAFYVYW